MTQSEETPVAPRNIQGQTLEQIVKLSIECAAQEQRIEQQHTEALERENAAFQEKTQEDEQQHKSRLAEVTTATEQRQKAIQVRYDTQLQTIEAAHHKVEEQLDEKKEDLESAIKKRVEKDTWDAERALVALEMQADHEAQQAKQDLEKRKEEVAALTKLETATQLAMARCHGTAFPVDTTPDAAAEERITRERVAVLNEARNQSLTLLKELQALGQPRIGGDVMRFIVAVVAAGVAGGIGWYVPQNAANRTTASVGAGAGVLVLGIVVFVVFALRSRARVRAKAATIYVPLKRTLAVALRAAKADPDSGANARQKRVRDARAKRDADVKAATYRARQSLAQATEQLRKATADEAQQYKTQLAQNEKEKQGAQEDLQKTSRQSTAQIDEECAKASQGLQAKHTADVQAIEAKYDADNKALAARWEEGLNTIKALLSAGSGIDPQLVDWNSPAWQQWKSPTEFGGQVRFGDMDVDLALLTENVPKRLKLPGTFTVPAMLAMPDHASLLVETDHAGRPAANDLARLVMARLLTQMPAGRVKFIIFDPVGLGQTFAGFMHLADHDESLIGSRIWTETDHMQQRLADLTEHMETVIQKYLRNEYATIDEYNSRAGELAEPYRFLVISDFPTGFEPESLQRVASIVRSGPRCGVFTIILRDTSQAVPKGSRMEDIVARSVRLRYKNNAFTWEDEVFKRFPLHIDAPPEEESLTRLMDVVGRAAKQAKRVEVPFQSIAPSNGEFWSMSSKEDLRVPIGKSGATRRQSMRLGVGVAQHALVAGKTGSGKSNLMHTIVTNMAMWYGPDEVEFYLVDFKKGVEFKAYANSHLPHARAIAVESDREFGVSVLQRVDAEMTRRGAMFRDVGAQEIGAYREKTGNKLPRTLLLIDEFQEFFSEDDKLGQEAAGLLDRVARQGRAFGVHMVLGSQTIGGSSGLPRTTLGQIAVRVALQCTEADSQIILGDNNSAARLLSRPGEAIYNDQGGAVEANSPFQIAFLPDGQRQEFLERVRTMAHDKAVTTAPAIVFEGNAAALIRENHPLMDLLEGPTPAPGAGATTVGAYVGEPVAIKAPTAVQFRRQSGANLLVVGQQEESSVGIFAAMAASLAAARAPGDAIFYLLDGTPADSRYFGLLEKVLGTFPQQTKIVSVKQVPEAINELAGILTQRQGEDTPSGPGVFMLLFGLQRYRMLRAQKEDFSFTRGDEPAGPKTDQQFTDLLSEGPALGLHTLIWADTPITVERTLDRGSMRQFDHRILFQMSAADSSNLIDSPLANRLGEHRALLYSEERGTVEKFRPYEVPDEAWIQFLTERLKNRRA